MARIEALDSDTATGESAELLNKVRHELGSMPALMRLLSHSPAALEGFLALRSSLRRATLPVHLRERIAIAAMNSCHCCMANHRHFGRCAGISVGELDAAMVSASADPAAAAVLRFARSLAETRGHVEDSELAAVRAAGFGDAAIIEIVAVVAVNMFANFVNNLARSAPDSFAG